MQLREFNQRQDSKAVWLSDDEIAALLNATETEEQRFGLGIMARSGLRVAEAATVASDDLVETNCGSMVRVWEGKNDDYRESPVPSDLFYLGRALGRGRDHWPFVIEFIFPSEFGSGLSVAGDFDLHESML